MPTGYTSKLYDGKPQTFPEFVMECARAFGAELRDEPHAEIPEEFNPSRYHDEGLAKAQKRLMELDKLSLADADACAQEDYEAALTRHQEEVKRRTAMRGRYTAMLEQVRDWHPPTDEHTELKKFMEQQLTESIDWDTKIHTDDLPERKTARAWLDAERSSAEWNRDYHDRQRAKAIERAGGRTAWVKALRESLDLQSGVHAGA